MTTDLYNERATDVQSRDGLNGTQYERVAYLFAGGDGMDTFRGLREIDEQATERLLDSMRRMACKDGAQFYYTVNKYVDGGKDVVFVITTGPLHNDHQRTDDGS